MKLQVIRFGFGKSSTIGKLYVDGKFFCYTLEDEPRKVKVPGETCIPEGKYRIKLRKEGGFHTKYAKLFPTIHKGMLWLWDVKNFQWILIHLGNTELDTAGCLLVGMQPIMTPDAEFKVGDSKAAYLKLYPLVAEALEKGEEVTIEIKRATIDE